MDTAALIVAGVITAFVLIRVWQAGGANQEPAETRQVRARVVSSETNDHLELDEVGHLNKFVQLTAQKARDRAYAREAERMIEQQAGRVSIPWGWPPADKVQTDPPKA